MNFWTGSDVNTGAMVTAHDAPLRIGIEFPGGPVKLFQASAVHKMIICVSMHLGTAMVAYVADGSGGLLVIEAAPKADIISGRHHAALREARCQIEKETELERAWNDTTGHSDDAIANILRDSLRNRP